MNNILNTYPCTDSDVRLIQNALSKEYSNALKVFGGLILVFLLVPVFLAIKGQEFSPTIYLVILGVFVIAFSWDIIDNIGRLKKDLDNSEKYIFIAKIKDKIGDNDNPASLDDGVLVLEYNNYCVDKISVPASIFHTTKLFSELKISVSKNAHVFLESGVI
jgi:hypothetical protein